MRFGNSWHSKPLDDLEINVERATACLQHFEFDAIAAIGASGVILAPVVAYKMKKTFVYVRKEGDANHGSSNAVGVVNSRYVIIDDLTCSGQTISRVQVILGDYDLVCAGVYFYDCQDTHGSYAARLGLPTAYFDNGPKIHYPPEVKLHDPQAPSHPDARSGVRHPVVCG